MQNVLIDTGEVQKRKFCPICKERVLPIQNVLTCPKCGDRFQSEDLRPKGTLVSADSRPFLTQPATKRKNPEDIPDGAYVVQESEELR